FDAVTQGKISAPEADLSWQVRAWSQWVLDMTRGELAKFYPVYAEFEAPGKPNQDLGDLKIAPTDQMGRPAMSAINADFSEDYLKDKHNPRWIAKPTVAYLWARTVKCKNCRAEIPLLKTSWLCKRQQKRVLLTLRPNTTRTAVTFGIERDVPIQ